MKFIALLRLYVMEVGEVSETERHVGLSIRLSGLNEYWKKGKCDNCVKELVYIRIWDDVRYWKKYFCKEGTFIYVFKQQ